MTANLLITALHKMQTRSRDENSVRPTYVLYKRACCMLCLSHSRPTDTMFCIWTVCVLTLRLADHGSVLAAEGHRRWVTV